MLIHSLQRWPSIAPTSSIVFVEETIHTTNTGIERCCWNAVRMCWTSAQKRWAISPWIFGLLSMQIGKMNQCWLNVGPPSATLAQNWPSIGLMYRVCYWISYKILSHYSDFVTVSRQYTAIKPPVRHRVLEEQGEIHTADWVLHNDTRPAGGG